MPAKSDKREAILRATMKLIAKKGFHNTPMSEIAKRAGTSQGISYHYFKNKEELIHTLYYESKAKLANAVLENDSDDLTLEARFHNVLSNLIDFYITNPDILDFMYQYETSPYGKAVQLADIPEFKRLTILTERSIEENVIKDYPREMIVALTGGTIMMLVKAHHMGTVTLTNDLKKEAVESCWKAIKY